MPSFFNIFFSQTSISPSVSIFFFQCPLLSMFFHLSIFSLNISPLHVLSSQTSISSFLNILSSQCLPNVFLSQCRPLSMSSVLPSQYLPFSMSSPSMSSPLNVLSSQCLPLLMSYHLNIFLSSFNVLPFQYVPLSISSLLNFSISLPLLKPQYSCSLYLPLLMSFLFNVPPSQYPSLLMSFSLIFLLSQYLPLSILNNSSSQYLPL